MVTSSPEQEEHQPVGASPEETTRMTRGMEQLHYEERLIEFYLFNWASLFEKRRLQGDLIATSSA